MEVEVTQVVQQQQQEEQEAEEDLGLELDESAKSLRTCPLPTKPAAGSLKGSSPRPAVQQTIVNFFSNVTVARSTSNKTAAEKRREKRKQKVKEAASHPRAPARAANIDKTRVIRLHEDRRKDGEGDKEEEGSRRRRSLLLERGAGASLKRPRDYGEGAGQCSSASAGTGGLREEETEQAVFLNVVKSTERPGTKLDFKF